MSETRNKINENIMNEFKVYLHPKSGGARIAVRLFAYNTAAAIREAKEIYPSRRTGAVERL